MVLGNRLPDDKPYLLNLKNDEKYELPFSITKPRLNLDFAAVSTDGKWLAYIELFEKAHLYRLHVISSDFEEQHYLDLPKDWGKIVNWLDNQRLLISTSVASLPEGVFPNGKMMIVNPFLRNWEILAPELPVQISTDPSPWYYWPDNPIVIFDPSLTRAVYLSLEGFLLIDTASQKIILRIRTQNYASRPSWSPQGNSFAMVIDNAEYPIFRSEIFQLDREGHSTPITNLANAFGNNNVVAESFQWSPDGNKIAFTYFVNDMSTNEHIAVVDVRSGQTVDYCLPSVGLLPPIWSPNSQLIAFSSATSEEMDKAEYWQTVVVDTVKEYAVQVAETMLPLGWMVSP